MNNLHIKTECTTKEEYNSLPVFYCKECLSLNIKTVADTEFCDDCSSTDIGQCSISEWEELYKQRFGHKYIEK